jgi:putative ABC transport system permease protein
MGIPLEKGRFFARTDSETTSGVAIINEAFARRYWPNEDPLGKQFTIGQIMGPAWSDPAPREVVGIVGDTRERAVDEEPVPEMFIPYTQLPPAPLELFVKEIPLRWVFRTSGDPGSIVGSVQKEVLSVEPSQAIAAVRTMDDVVAKALMRRRFEMVLLCAFAILALAIAAFGIYGVIAAFVAQRRFEIAVRLALGATPGQVLKRIVYQGLIVTAIGLLVGLCAAALLGNLIKSMLYKVPPSDAPSFVVVVLFLLGISLFSSVVPGVRISKTNPALTLRQD